MSSWRGHRPARVPPTRVPTRGWLAASTMLSLGAGQSMGNAVPPWAVAVCGVAAAGAGVAGRQARHVRGTAAILGAAATGAIALSVLTGSSWSVNLIVVGLASGLPWLGGRYLHQQDELVGEATQRARLQERSRIAQDMHDSLGHELNLLALRAGAIEMDPTLTSTHQGAASELRAGASSAITQLAAVIGVLRGEGAVAWGPTNPDIAGLVRRAAEAGMDVTLERNGPVESAPLPAHCIHRVVQEGITNAARHAPGSSVTVMIDSSADGTQVTVTNTPSATSLRRSPGSRTGIVALTERLQACGGTLCGASHRGGFRLTANIPRGGGAR